MTIYEACLTIGFMFVCVIVILSATLNCLYRDKLKDRMQQTENELMYRSKEIELLRKEIDKLKEAIK